MDLAFNYKQWGVDETCRYLQQEGLGKWENKFRENNITGIGLRDLTVDDLEEMDIEQLSDRLKILHNIRKLWQIPGKVFNDPIHGHVELHPLLIKIIDTPQFQRLRYIKQLGGGYFVYPGASHNRFEHSIGVGYLAGELAQALRTRQPLLGITDRDILCVQIAGLCHDLGHGPFSHLFDRMFIPKAGRDKPWKHEDASLDMFDHLVKCNHLEEVMTEHGLVLPQDVVFIKEMIKGVKTHTAQGEIVPWPYKGRTEDMSFLYEIVANKTNNVDVDKFDYFARDCYHLGIHNNFDHRRFLKFARVFEVNGRKHICTRDKEVDNMYEMFHTRMSLHRRAYQHKVNKIIETMIADAFLKADKHIQIEGSGGKKFTLSSAIDDMEAYTKLTDHVFEQILNSSSQGLAEARQILNRIVSRNFYKFLGEVKPKNPNKEKKNPDKKKKNPDKPAMIYSWESTFPQDDGLTPDDFGVLVISLDYGNKDKDPIDKMYFYSKYDSSKAEIKEQVSVLRPTRFSEQSIWFYCKNPDESSLEAAQEHFEQWRISYTQDGDTVTPALPEENIPNP